MSTSRSSKITFHDDCRRIDWQELSTLLHEAGLGLRPTAQLRAIFRGSQVRCFVSQGGKLIGVGRAITDGVVNSAIYDVAVRPTHQGAGVGKKVMNYLLDRLPPNAVLLVSVPDKQGFYLKCGFRRLRTALLKRDFSTPGVPDTATYFYR
jgi:ribosomal protein S18 acetylase RimI-like enzyme